MTRMVILVLALVLVLTFAAPAFAVSGAGGAGAGFGLHVAGHVQDVGVFTGTMNPGVMHKGFSGWTGP